MTTAVVSRKPRRAKGEQTRRQILEAALRVIAEQGYRALTHRAVAKEAGVNLSLTTYYFKDLGEMLSEAFVHYKEGLRRDVDAHWQTMFEYLDQFDDKLLKESEVRRQVVEKLARSLADFIENQIQHQAQGVAVEMTFFFDLHLDESQRELAYKLRNRFLEGFIKLFRRLDSPDPDADAELILGTLHRLQCQAIAVPKLYSSEMFYRQTYRLLSALTGISP